MDYGRLSTAAVGMFVFDKKLHVVSHLIVVLRERKLFCSPVQDLSMVGLPKLGTGVPLTRTIRTTTVLGQLPPG